MASKYEMLLLTPASLDEPSHQQAMKKISELIAKFEGKIIKTDNWGIKKLAYEIKRESSGRYELIDFEIPGKMLSKLNKELGLMPEVMRSMVTIKIPEEKTRKRIPLRQPAEEEDEATPRPSKSGDKAESDEAAKTETKEQIAEEKAVEPKKEDAGKKKEESRISIDDLDEKLDEILKDEL